MGFVEFQDFGWNAMTIGFIGTIFFLFLQTWGTYSQAKTIWSQKSGLSVSVPLFAYNTGSFFIGFVYGLTIKSLAVMLIGGVLCIMHLPIMLGLFKYKKFKRWEVFFIFGLLIAVIICISLPYKDYAFFSFNIGTIIVLTLQPWEIIKNKDAGSVEPRLNLTFAVSSIFWIIYGFAIGDWVLKIISPSYLILHSIIILMWYLYKKPSLE